jgi:hypothetical protein
MEKITLKLHEVYELNLELKGSINQQTGETIRKGILDEKISISVKYWLDKLSEKLKTEIDLVEKLKEEIIKKLGEVDESGNYNIPMGITKGNDDQGKPIYDVNPKYIEYQTEFEKLLQEEVEIEYAPLTLEQIDTKSDLHPEILFKLITE